MSIAVIGSDEFVAGFALAGVKHTIVADEGSVLEAVKQLKTQKEITITVIEEQLLLKIDKLDRGDIESCISPVFVPLSISAAQDNLRYLIKKSIGVDIQD